jgi:uncharacterized protein (DUF488 family)
MSQVFTIGFTGKRAATFFDLLRRNGVKRVIDVRLNNASQLAGFSKRDDLRFFLEELCGADYVHLPELAPTKPLLKAYRGGELCWEDYADRFLSLLAGRKVEALVDPELLQDGCLLCSEHQPHFCHRRLVAEYLGKSWGLGLKLTHLT